MSNLTTADWVEYMERDLRYKRERLARDARGLADRLTRLANRAENAGPDGYISLNDLGELQSASQFDAACGAYEQQRDDLKTLRAFLAEEQKAT